MHQNKFIALLRWFRQILSATAVLTALPAAKKSSHISCILHLLVFTIMMAPGVTPSFAQHGATVPWVTYEAEDMTNTGTVMGPKYEPNVVEAESSGRRCVKLSATGQYMQFTAKAAANSMVVRYSVPDTANGVGADYTLSLYINKAFAGKV